jgi:hypothetical protein
MHLVRVSTIHLFKGESWRRKGKGKAGESEAKMPRHSHDLTVNSNERLWMRRIGPGIRANSRHFQRNPKGFWGSISPT